MTKSILFDIRVKSKLQALRFLPHEMLQNATDTITNFLYHVETPERTRTTPLEVLAVGLSRSGTDSLRQALLHLGYENTYHGFDAPVTKGHCKLWHQLGKKKWRRTNSDADITAEDFDQIIGHCAAVTDMPAAAFAPELIAAYPKAKVILNTRKDVDAWYDSNIATFGELDQDWLLAARYWFTSELYWVMKCFEVPFYSYYYGNFEATGKWVYKQHTAATKGLVPPEKLLEWSVEDGWQPLCDFLEKPVPDMEFPSGNAPKEMLETSYRHLGEQMKLATRNMIIAATILFGLVALSITAAMRRH